MTEMLTAKDVQTLLHVDRSTVYRMAEAGQLPAFKVGRQWRFPAHEVQSWLTSQGSATEVVFHAPQPQPEPPAMRTGTKLAEQLPLECVQLIQDTFAEAIGVMVVVTDMEGQPVTRISHTCGLFAAVLDTALPRCVEQWHEMAQMVDLEPSFMPSHLGLLCARGFIRVGTELKGMVVVGGITPDTWPPTTDEVEQIAAALQVPVSQIETHLDEVFHLDESDRARALKLGQRLANIVSHIVQERDHLLGRLEAIADLTKL